MDRAKALLVLQEILKTLEQQAPVTSVSLDEPTSTGNYTIKIGSSLNDCSRNQMHAILSKHELAMEENRDSIVIYSP
ncbi:MAG TPA: hypothetical protein VF893_03100 [Candidatus Bathyarchaeia archaeon]